MLPEYINSDGTAPRSQHCTDHTLTYTLEPTHYLLTSLTEYSSTMSLTRQFFRELRPLFRMLEEPFGRPSTYGSLGYPSRRGAFFDDPFFTAPTSIRPAIDVSEQGDSYVVEAELPGVKKENVNVRIGDGGRTLTIEGKVFSRSAEPQQQQSQAQASGEAQPASSSSSTEGTYTYTHGRSSSTALTTRSQ